VVTWKPDKNKKGPKSPGLTIEDSIVKGSFFLQCNLLPLREKATEGIHTNLSHTHDSDEILVFFGTNVDNWRELGGEVELWLDGEKHNLSQSFAAFVPKGMAHCPMIVHRVDRPFFLVSTGPASNYARKNETPVDKSQSQTLAIKTTEKYLVKEQTEKRRARGSRGLYLADETVKGADFFWQGGLLQPKGAATKGAHNSETSHVHDCDEILGFFGTDLNDWPNLGGKVELWIDGEKHMFEENFLALFPKGVKHSPLVIHNVDKPIFHFTTGPAQTYVIQNEAAFRKPGE
jgi:quercetin dioxygenase-like cupin family protein